MKCIKKQVTLRDGAPSIKVVRATDKRADKLVSAGTWSYTSKSGWKSTGRKYYKQGGEAMSMYEIIDLIIKVCLLVAFCLKGYTVVTRE